MAWKYVQNLSNNTTGLLLLNTAEAWISTRAVTIEQEASED